MYFGIYDVGVFIGWLVQLIAPSIRPIKHRQYELDWLSSILLFRYNLCLSLRNLFLQSLNHRYNPLISAQFLHKTIYPFNPT